MAEKWVPTERERTKPSNLWLSGELIARTDRAAVFLGCSRSELIRSAIRYAAIEQVKRGR